MTENFSELCARSDNRWEKIVSRVLSGWCEKKGGAVKPRLDVTHYQIVYYFLRLRYQARPASPLPRRSKVEGSGTGAVCSVIIPSKFAEASAFSST